MVLHTLNASPASAAFADCVKVLQTSDAVVLMGEGAYAALEGTAACKALQATGAEIFLLAADAKLAGVATSEPPIRCIDMNEMVILTERFPRQLAWY
jgi:tRNA 2-thiouridine synthesizing protein B